MADKKMIATRESYGKELLELGREFDNIVVMDADLAGATKTGVFAKEFPDRFFNCGIQEGNMVDTAAGMSTLGLVPFISTFAMFMTGRAYEMIRNTVGYPKLNVKLVASHGGISVGEDGASHQCNEDFALMRTIPGMTVMCPADDVEARKMIRAAYHHDGPVYIRTGRSAVPVINDEDMEFEIGKANTMRDGKDLTIIATGLMVAEALQAAEELAQEGIDVRVLDMHTIKPLDEEAVLKAAKETGKILTAEEHSVIGGLGEAVCSFLSENYPTPVRRVGIYDVFGHSGPARTLLHQFGLDAEGLKAEVRKMLEDTKA